MSDLVFATLLTELKDAWADMISAPDLIMLLYDAVADPIGLKNQNGDAICISKATASKIMNRQPGGNPLGIIRKSSADPKVINSIETYFVKKIENNLLESKKDQLVENLGKLLREDKKISDTERKKLLSIAQKNQIAKFLSGIYLYTLTVRNVSDDADRKRKADINLEKYKKQPLAKIKIPESILKEEERYANALLAVYGQQRNIPNYDMRTLALYPEDKEDFEDHRDYYFAAEAVRRGTRDIIHEEEQFDVLKKEVHEGVKEVWKEPYKSGQVRLLRVLSQATRISLEGCLLSKDTIWIGNAQRKGVCHFLVKDGKLRGWIRADDGKTI